jgi:hypothetical protein
MLKTTKLFCVLMFFMTSLLGCYVEPPFVPEFPVGQVEGYQPVYASSQESVIAFDEPRPLSSPAKIYSIGNYLLINEKYQGIHVYDNTDPSSPVALGFLRVAGNSDMAVRGEVLYVDHLTDLVALDVSDWNNVSVISRLKQEHWRQDIPPAGGRYFECVDHTKGEVVGWKMATLNNPKCFR